VRESEADRRWKRRDETPDTRRALGDDEDEDGLKEEGTPQAVDWKRQYKIRYNWARGKCAVEELKLGGDADVDDRGGRKTLVKVVEGFAVTADKAEGLRAWDLKSRQLMAQIGVGSHADDPSPSCIAIDDGEFEKGALDVALGFTDGSFGVWRLFTGDRRLVQRYRHEKSSNGELIAVTFSYPYLLTATQSVLVSLYTFYVPTSAASPSLSRASRRPEADAEKDENKPSPPAYANDLSGPYLLTSLDSHTSRPPLALSIRKTATTVIASVAYTFSTRQGWSIGIQDLHISAPTADIRSTPEIVTTRIAYATPLYAGGASHPPLTPPATPRNRRSNDALEHGVSSATSSPSAHSEPGPTTLCYSHPYLLATLPDNTLVLYMCTSNASSLSISQGIRLWGHTSGISDAEITARGKAVSVSFRGDEMRVWELEGRSASIGSRSVAIRPDQTPARGEGDGDPARDWDERRNWVGFDDEMVIVLKEKKGARDSLMVYDFT
jgi:hypothetical protein